MAIWNWFKEVRPSALCSCLLRLCFMPSEAYVVAPPLRPSQKPKQDYEALLQTLSLQISDRQQRLSEIKLRERRTTLAFTLYAIGLWILYVALWWFNVLPRLGLLGGLLGWGSSEDEFEFEEDSEYLRIGGALLLALPVFIGPVGCVYCYFALSALQLP